MGNEAIQRAIRVLQIRDPSWLRLGALGSAVFLAAGCTLIVLWHVSFVQAAPQLDRSYAARPGARGIYLQRMQRFFYFFYYTGYFPVSWLGSRKLLVEDRDTALAILEPVMDPEPPHALHSEALQRKLWMPPTRIVNEDYTVIRGGDLGQIFLFYPHAWLHGEAASATPRTFNRGLALASLLALFVSLSLLEHRLLAIVLVGLLGSHPFQLVHLYRESNLWAYPTAMGCLMLALCAPLFLGTRSRRLHLLLPILAGALLATALEVRPEPALYLLSAAAICVTASGGWRRRAALLGLLLASFTGASLLWSAYWNHKLDEASRVVKLAGGTASAGLRNRHHSLWHPLWVGLCDFGRDRGYGCTDQDAYAYAIPKVNERLGTRYTRGADDYLLHQKDPETAGLRLKPETIPEYQRVLREKVLEDVLGDPVWYLGILGRRMQRIFELAPPVRLGLGARFLEIPFTAWVWIPVLAVALAARRWGQVKLLLFYVPTSLTALLVSTGGSVVYHSAFSTTGGFVFPTAFHLTAFAVLLCWGVSALGLAAASLRRRPVPS